MDSSEQFKIDKTLIELDGTSQKKKLGANAILAVSMAVCKLTAIENKLSLFKVLESHKHINYQYLIKYNKRRCSYIIIWISKSYIRPEKSKSFSEAMRKSF